MGLRVGVYTDTVVPRPDGVAVSTEAMCRALLYGGTEVEIVAPNTRTPYNGTVPLRVVRSVRMPGRDYDVALTLPWWRSPQTSAGRYDVVHVQTVGPIGLAGLIAARRASIPVVLTWHTDFGGYQRYYPEIGLARPLVALALRATGERGSMQAEALVPRLINAFDAVVAPTRKVSVQLTSAGPRCKLVVIASPTLPLAEPTESAAAVRRRLSIPPTARVVLFVGRLRGEKNLALLLSAFADALAHRRDLRLVLVGPSARSGRLHWLPGQLGIADNIRAVGAIRREALAAYYLMASVLVVPSLFETQALVAHEAEAFGLPVIVVDSELATAGSRGRILATPEPAALASAILIATDHSTRAAPTLPTASSYSPNAIDYASALCDLYEALIEESAARRAR